MERLETIAVKQLADQSLSAEELVFFNQMIEMIPATPMPYVPSFPQFNGWYPSLFYRSAVREGLPSFHTDYGVDKPDFIVADVHTDVPCSNCDIPDPGSVLHEAIGRVNMMVVAVEKESGLFLYTVQS